MKNRALALSCAGSIVALGCSSGSGDGAGGNGGHAEASDTGAVNGSSTGMMNASTHAASGATGSSGSGQGGASFSIQTVFIVMMENHDWSDIAGNSSAPYINNVLAPAAARAAAYKNPPGLHPSEPNYLWLEAGSNLTVTNDDDPPANHQSTTEHLTTDLEAAGLSWKDYAEGISGTTCPQTDTALFAVRHVPQLFFDDVTDGGSKTSAHCIQHVRPYSELQSDLTANTVARYNFITPNICHDMHGQSNGVTCPSTSADLINVGDTWLSTEIPKITASAAYSNGGVIFVIWDEGSEKNDTTSDGPLPFFVISQFAKAGYTGNVAYTHSSTLRTLQEIFGLAPFLRGAGNAADLADLFTTFP